MKAGDTVYTPRFCTVTIQEVFEDAGTAGEKGYTEPTHYEDPKYNVYGKHTGTNRMQFAAAKKKNA